jgi:hypothetical protein
VDYDSLVSNGGAVFIAHAEIPPSLAGPDALETLSAKSLYH